MFETVVRRRVHIAGLVAALAPACTGGDPAPVGPPPETPHAYDVSFGNSAFGAWQNDEFGLPAFRYDGCTASDCKDPGDVFHQIGNGYTTAVAH